MAKLMKPFPLSIVGIAIFCGAFILKSGDTGQPWQNKMQKLPGRLECEFYNTGGEGVAYHDSDSTNNGSGKLNPANGTFLNEFRMKLIYRTPKPTTILTITRTTRCQEI